MANLTGVWEQAAAQPGIAPYARFITERLLADRAAGKLKDRDGVVVALRIESDAAAAPALAAPVLMSAADRAAMAPGADWPVAVSGVVRLADLGAVSVLAAVNEGLVLVDVGQVIPADALRDAVAGSSSAAAIVAAPVPEAIVAVIDDGIPLGHGRFRDSTGGTRIAAAWAMDAAACADHDFGYGRIFRRDEIDALIGAATGPGGFDDGRFMALSGLVDPARDVEETVALRIAHGAGVADLLCGHEPGDGIARSGGLLARDPAAVAPVIAVQLPSAQARDTSGAGLRPFLRDALRFVLDEAARLGGGAPVPLVINLSYGLGAGPHDGTHAVERDIAGLLAPEPHVHLVLPAGNGAMARGHAHVSLAPGASEVLNWQIWPDDRTPSFAEIWPDGDDLELRLEAPDGTIGPPVSPDAERARLVRDGATVGEICHHAYAVIGQGPGILVSLAPSFDLDNPGRVVPHGRWRLHLRNAGKAALDVHAWVQRDVSAQGRSRLGRQSVLVDDAYAIFDEIGDLRDRDTGASHVTRTGTISAMATGDPSARVHVIGAWQGGGQRRPAPYSARGMGGGRMPDMAAIADNSRVHAGVLAAGTASGSVVALSGTSVAAPAYARALVNALVRGEALSADAPPGSYQIKPGVVVADGIDRVGAGTLDPVWQPHPARGGRR